MLWATLSFALGMGLGAAAPPGEDAVEMRLRGARWSVVLGPALALLAAGLGGNGLALPGGWPAHALAAVVLALLFFAGAALGRALPTPRLPRGDAFRRART